MDKKIEKIEPGKYVELGYDLYAIEPDGTETLVHQTNDEDPERIVFGVTRGMIVPLEKAIEGLEPGGKFNVIATAEEAFGKHDPDQVAELDRDVFLVDGKFDQEMVKVGAAVPMMTADGYRITGIVLEVTPTHVKIDFNHPLADKAVRFDGKILTVRDATPDEIRPFEGGCGCGCDGGDCSDSGCTSGCCGGCN